MLRALIDLQATYSNYKTALQQIAQKIGDIEQEAEEHKSVSLLLLPLPPPLLLPPPLQLQLMSRRRRRKRRNPTMTWYVHTSHIAVHRLTGVLQGFGLFD